MKKDRYIPSMAEIKAWKDYIQEHSCDCGVCARAFGVPKTVAYYHAIEKTRRPNRYQERKSREAGREVVKGGYLPVNQVFTPKQRHYMICDALGVDPW